MNDASSVGHTPMMAQYLKNRPASRASTRFQGLAV
jgi:hypothetical protein